MSGESRIVRGRGMLVIALLLIARVGWAAGPDTSQFWFKPVLTVDKSPACAAFLEATQKTFLTEASWETFPAGPEGSIAGFEAVELESLPKESDDPESAAYLMVDGAKLFIGSSTFPGCGGACESQSMVIATQPAQLMRGDYLPNDENRVSTDSSPGPWKLFKDVHGSFYLAAVTGNAVQVIRVVAPKKWQVSCSITVMPAKMTEATDPAVRSAAAAIEAFDNAASALAGDTGGNCGTMRTPGRWAGFRSESLAESLYRPWAVQSVTGAWPHDSYVEIMGELNDWSMGGLYEYQALATYGNQFAATARELAALYNKKLGLNPTQSAAMAQVNLEEAIQRSFHFDSEADSGSASDPSDSSTPLPLRQAILGHQPIARIQSLAAQVTKFDSPGPHESLLNLAVTYPEALQVLLERGADPNVANEFGKTPLMYAAQFNQQQSVQLLLEHGADPNAATVWPADDCGYVLRTAKMTALHYAVRYGSTGLVRLLLSKGAVTFRKTESQIGANQYPLDWLKRYTDPASRERNPNIPDADGASLATLLRVPDPAELTNLAATLTQKAESEYAAGKTQSAYQTLKIALTAQPTTPRALSDFTLVALKFGQLGESAEAATAVIDSNRAPSERAAAWFNLGLACEKATNRAIAYDGKYYCQDSPVDPFLAAWKLEPNPARAHKLEDLFEKGLPGGCVVTAAGDSKRTWYYFSYNSYQPMPRGNAQERTYVLHPSNVTIDPTKIHWDVFTPTPADPHSTTTVSPHQVERVDLGGYVITILESEARVRKPVTVEGGVCAVEH